ncbi:MAG: hypothetical protein KJO21_08205 [Verrucomicrobiae bacterium]|nr:hypothetical protein [Verrucomicrobiae bacterium]NNJ43457.1 hypothetical protein [Akkermansiaceae bacterium]
MKYTTITTLAALLLGTAGAFAQSAYTKPSGFVTTTIHGATDNGAAPATPKFSVLTVSLRSADQAAGAIVSFGGHLAATSDLPSRQVLTMSDVSWKANQWSDAPHLVYLEKDDGSDDGAEQSLLVLSNTADTLTVATDYNLSGRFAADDLIKLVVAPTLGTVFGADGGGLKTDANPNTADNLYIWDANDWTKYYHNGTNWSRQSPYLANANNVIIFPDEGVFILRKEVGDVDLVLTGLAPVKNQISDVPSGFSFVSSRYSVDTKLKDMGFQSLAGWVSNENPYAADNLYSWDAAEQKWVKFYHNGSHWVRFSPYLGNADDVVISSGTPVFVSRLNGGVSDSANTHTLPYHPEN